MKDGFRGDLRFLSNFYPSPIMMNGKEYATVEHAFQAAKTEVPPEQEEIRLAETPGRAKRLGHKVTLRSDWYERRVKVMRELVRRKFKDEKLMQKLLDTPDEDLVEYNQWHDNYWGDCVCPKCEGWKGHNHLGKILLEIKND